MKRLLLLCILGLSFCPLLLQAQTFFTVDNIRYMIEDDHAVIARQDQELSGNVSIPATVTYEETPYSVTRLMSPDDSESGGVGAFQECEITGISLPASISEIPAYSFCNCNSLSSVTIPQNVTTIGYLAFAGCSSLSSVTISKNVTYIYNGAFVTCSNLSSFNVAEENLYYSSENGVLFNKNKTILLQYPQAKTETSYIIPNSVTSITYMAFSGCSSLTSVTIPNSMKSIGEYAFKDCSGLTSITIPKSVTSLGFSAFEGCSGLVEVSIGSNVQTFNSSVFKGCQHLSEVWCYATVVPTVESDAFAESNYTNATLYVRNTLLDEYKNTEIWNSFKEIKNISSLQNYAPYHTIFVADGIRYMTEDDEVVIARQDKELTGNHTIPATVTYEETPYSVTRLMSPDDSESGGGGAFQECKITGISLPISVTEIPNYTFKECKQLNSVILNGAITRIGDYAFSNCKALSTINLPDDVTEMGQGAFEWTGLTTFKVPAGVTELSISLFDVSKITYLEIPASVNHICWHFFTEELDEQWQPISKKRTIKMYQRDCRNIVCDGGAFGDITNIDLQVPAGGKVVYQEYYPWLLMNSITEYGEDTGDALVPDQRHVTIDDIRYMLKDGKANVDIQPATLSEEVTIPEKVTYEGVDYPVTSVMGAYDVASGGAFSYTQATKVTLPNSVTKIGLYAFKGAQSLQEVVLNEGITEIVEGAFMECPELTTINIPSTMTVLPRYIFKDCPKLKNLTLHEGLTEIQNEALYNTRIETLTIPSTCTHFNACALYLPNLKTLYMNIKEPTDIQALSYWGGWRAMNSSVFSDYGGLFNAQEATRQRLSQVDLIVPLGCAESYKALNPWIFFRSVTEQGSGDYYQPKMSGVNIDGINYILEEKTVDGQDEPVRIATIARQKTSLNGDIIIPDKVSYANHDYNVTEMVVPGYEAGEAPGIYNTIDGAFQECAITSISLPATLTTVSAGAFNGCPQLKSVTLAEGITTIGGGAFANCSSLEEIYLPETINDMSGWYIFGNCRSLKKVNIPKLVTTIGNGCFMRSGIETFIIPKNVTSLGEACFAAMWEETSVKTIKICHDSYSDGSISFPENMFFDISGITLIVPEGTTASFYSQVYPWKDFENIIEYTDQNDEHQYNAYRIELEEESDENPATARRRASEITATETTIGFTPSGVFLELPAEVEKDGILYTVQYNNAPTTMPANDIVVKAVLTPAELVSVTISSIGKLAYSSDKVLDFSNVVGLKAYTVTGYDNDSKTIWMTRVNEVPAGTGIMLKGEAGIYEIPVKTTSKSSYKNYMKAIVEGGSVSQTEGDLTNYYLAGNGANGPGLYQVNGSVTLGANRSYLQLPTTLTSTGSEGNENITISSIGKLAYSSSNSLDFTNVAGLKAYTVTGYNKATGTIWLSRVYKVPAATGVYLKGDPGDYTVPTLSMSGCYSNMLKSCVVSSVIDPTEGDLVNYYLAGSGTNGPGFYPVEGSVTLGNNRSYLQIPTTVGTSSRAAAVQRASVDYGIVESQVDTMPLYGINESGATAIDSINNDTTSEKVIYNLNGQRTYSPSKGVYIMNGKKVIVL